MSYAFYSANHLPSHVSPGSPASSWGTVSTSTPMFINGVNTTFGVRHSIDICSPPMLSSENREEQAFTPPLSNIMLQSGPQGEWLMQVQNPSGITVQDLCTGVVDLYYKILNQNETYNLPSNVMAVVRHSASLRQQANPGSGNRLQRVDMLVGHTRIRSVQLSPDRTRCHVYMK